MTANCSSVSAGFERNAPRRAHDNAGYFYIRWHPKTKFVTRGKLLIRADGIDQRRRDHAIREEIAQVLGLMRDIDAGGSIFSQADAGAVEYSPLDRLQQEPE